METVKPTRLRLEASSYCQLRCPSCPTTTGAIHPAVGSGFLTLGNFQKLLDQNPDLAAVELSNYGEIFLNPQLPKILEAAHTKGVAVTAENGVNLNYAGSDALESLVKYRLRVMTCSIDGASQETYELYRVRGRFEKVIENIKTINRLKREYRSRFPHLRWQFVVFGHNEHELIRAYAMARELNMEFSVKLSWDESLSPIRNKEAVRNATKMGVASRLEFRARFGRDYLDSICHQLWDSPQINWDGRVLGCCRNFWSEFGGNAFKDGLVSSLNGERISYARDMLRGRVPARSDIPCTTCDLFLNRKAAGNYIDRR
jgi:MoaA/NifB/PqqE/SkfB family radical SAM enzyme